MNRVGLACFNSILRHRSVSSFASSPHQLTVIRPLHAAVSSVEILKTHTITHPVTQKRYKNRYDKFENNEYAHLKVGKWGKFYYAFLAGTLITVTFFPGGIVKSAAPEEVEWTNPNQESVELSEAKKKEEKRKTNGFRARRIKEYENRLRSYSTPDKIFRYFATLKVASDSGGEDLIMMKPDDFVRSITPGMMQPEGLGLDKFKKYDPKKKKLECNLPEDSIFYKLGEGGLINFSDFIFLLVVLSTPPRVFEIAFKMFDLNGDGDVEFKEFQQVRDMTRNSTSVGQRHRDHSVTGSVIKNIHLSALNIYFFGPKLDQKLTVEKFLDFQKQLQTDILWLEFQRCNPKDEKISEKQFAKILLLYAGMNEVKRKKMMKRIQQKFEEESQGITFDEYLDFYEVLKHINDIDTALMFYHVAGASIDKTTLKHVAKTVAKVNLSDHLVDTVFTLFDENDDGELSNKEFVAVMKGRMMRGLEKPKDIGFVKMFDAMTRCAVMTAVRLRGTSMVDP